MEYTDFADDEEKMRDFYKLTKDEFLRSYSYLTEEEYDLTASVVEKGENLIFLAKGINRITEVSIRKWAIHKFLEDMNKQFNNESIVYRNDEIRDTYINWDSNCGCSIIHASIGFEPIADYLIENDMEPTLSNAEKALNDLGERTEYWGDVIIEYQHSINIELLEELMGINNETIGEDEFIRDFKRYRTSQPKSI